jgi:acetolactate synthase-1/2/3 large subunit
MVDIYDFYDALNKASQNDDIINPCTSGMAVIIPLQTWKIKKGQRFTTNFVLGQMGAGLPHSIGAALATGKRVIHIEGEGGFQLNLQELETVRRLHLPIVIFIINNDGYLSIRQSQQKNFGRLTGADASSGFTTPSLRKIASAYNFPYFEINDKQLNKVKEILRKSTPPVIVEVFSDPNQQYRHRVQSKLVNGKMTTARLEDV